MDDYFNRKRYVGKWTPEFYFEELGDTDNFFIKLSYFINKSHYLLTKSTIGTPLDFELVDGDGVGVFAGLPNEVLDILASRNYKLASVSDGREHNPEGDLFVVTETYTYAPAREYVEYDNDVVPIWGLQDNSNEVSVPVVFGRRCKVRNEFYEHTVLQVANINAFETGDTICIYPTFRFYRFIDLVATVHRQPISYEPEHGETFKILRINRTNHTIELDGVINPQPEDGCKGNHSGLGGWDNSDGSNNNAIFCYECFLNRIEGGVGTPILASATLRIVSMRVVKKYSTREFKRRDRPIRITTSWHSTPPNAPEPFIPKRETGFELDTISRETTISPATWCNWASEGRYFQYAESEISHDKINNLYKRQIKETKVI